MSKVDDTGPDILKEYDNKSTLYGGLAKCLRDLLSQCLKRADINPQSITSRLKSRKSLEEKLSLPGKHFSQLADITAVTGVRVITYFPADVDKVAALLEREFEIDREHCIDKRVYQDPDRFGYKSLHYVVSLKEDCARLSEYSTFRGLKAEIQVRTVIQHAWAEIEHDLGYKNPAAVPKEARRKFFRLAALLEMADEEFTAIQDALTRRTSQVRADFQRGDFDVEIDSPSLAEFVTSDPLIIECDQEIADRAHLTYDISRSLEIDALASWLRDLGIMTIQQLRSLFTEKRQLIIDLGVVRLQNSSHTLH